MTENDKIILAPAEDKPDLEAAEQIQNLKASELERARKGAEGWRTGLGVLLGLIATVSVVKGRDTITSLPLEAQYQIGACLAAALVAASFGVFRATRAAYGLPQLSKIMKDKDVWQWKTTSTKQIVKDLRWAIYLTFSTLLLLALAIGRTWYTPEDPPAFVSAKRNDQSVCGKLMKGDKTGLTIKVAEDQTESVLLTELTSLSIVKTCSK